MSPANNVRSPDVTFVSNQKLPDGRSPANYGSLVPDLAVEVLSQSDSVKALGEKVGEYLECGVPIVWLVDPQLQTVTVYRSLTDIERYTAADTISGEPVLPGFFLTRFPLLLGKHAIRGNAVPQIGNRRSPISKIDLQEQYK